MSVANSHQYTLEMSPVDYPWDSQKKLKEMYHEQGLILKEIAEKEDVSITTVHRKMNVEGVETNGPGRWTKTPTYRTTKEGIEEVSGSHESVPVHRLVMVAEHGYDAVVNRDVHHENGIKYDNRPSNLKLMTTSQHTTLHNRRENMEDEQDKIASTD